MSDLRRQVYEGGVDVQVEVNQRALIDKVLARYSGEHTVFRELLQNADDARASHVELHFNATKDGTPRPGGSTTLPDFSKQLVNNVTVRNDGIVFREEDWSRLRKIAEGNPDEQMIGQFGVGFYSLFSMCEEPIVMSGEGSMLFFWKGDQLFVRRGPNPKKDDSTSEGKPWTTFHCDTREPIFMPELEPFCRFLANALAFTSSLRKLDLFFEDILLCHLEKKLAPKRGIEISRTLRTTTPQRFMAVQSAEYAPVQIDVRAMACCTMTPRSGTALNGITGGGLQKMLQAFTSSSSKHNAATATPSPGEKDLSAVQSAILFLRVINANVSVSVNSAFNRELQRATKKPPPKLTVTQLIYATKDEFDAGATDSTNEARRIFEGLVSRNLDSQGRVAIGFLTHQTSGNAASVAGRFIPTVERESLDFQAPTVSDWNRELLATLGILSRIVYEDEMVSVSAQWKHLSATDAAAANERSRLYAQAAHIARYFTFAASTPSPVVSLECEKAFFDAGKSSITLMSTQGPALASEIRYPNHELSLFIKDVPTLPEEVLASARSFINKLRDRGVLKEFSFEDVFKGLSRRALTVDEMRACLSWWIKLADNRAYDARTKERLLDVAMLMYGTSVLAMSAMTTFINTSTLPTDMPVPPDTLPYDLTRTFKTQDLRRVFGWKDLEVIDFLKHLLSTHMTDMTASIDTNMLQSPHFAEKVLLLLSRIWQNIPNRQQMEIVDLLKDRSCIPTRHGLKRPTDAYHPAVNLFEDLDVVVLPNNARLGGNLEKLLLALGVRKHVDLQLVFSRMLGGGTWSHKELLSYLVSVEANLSAEELDKLTKTAWLPKEGEAKAAKTGADGKPASKVVRWRAVDLYEPTPILRPLGLPLLEWGLGWRSFSPEGELSATFLNSPQRVAGKFLSRLGLQKHPPVEDLLRIASNAAKPDAAKAALAYFVAQHHAAGYQSSFSPEKHNMPFVPCLGSDGTFLTKPSEVYTNRSASKMGFAIVHPDWLAEASKFKLRTDPLPQDLLRKLVNSPPSNATEATAIFGYLSTRIGSFASPEIKILRDARILPIKDGSAVKMVAPADAYFSGKSALDPVFKELFIFVDDYGSAARPFLSACGVREAPTPAEIAQRLVDDPKRFYSLAGSVERYLRALRQIAVSTDALSQSLRRQMRDTPFFLGLKRTSSTQIEDDEDDEAGVTTQYVLVLPAHLVIIDDAAQYARFSANVLACPQEEVLEAFAADLGAVRVSKAVRRAYTPYDRANAVSDRAQMVVDTVVERASLFLHDIQHRNGKIARDDAWLKERLVAADVTKLELVNTLTYKGAQHVARQTVSAGAVLEPGSRGQQLTLLVAKNFDIDWFEVSETLCPFMLEQPRRNDELVFMTLLSTPLKTLKRRGYNVDRILNARRAEKEAQLERDRQQQLQDQLEAAQRPTARQLDEGEKQLAELLPQYDRATLRQELEKRVNDNGTMQEKVARAADELIQREASKPSAIPGAAPPGLAGNAPSWSSSGPGGSLFSKFRKGFSHSSPRLPSSSSLAGANAYQQPPANLPALPPTPQTQSALPDPHAQVSPVNDMKANVLRALAASRPDNSESMGSRPEMRQVKESESSYCDASGARDLNYLADVSGLRFYCAKDISDPSAVLDQHGEALRRFGGAVVKPVAQSFGLSVRSMHIFYDLEGPLVAFNRNGSIFLNLRYYMGWHDDAVAADDVQEALISWYFSTAHELAHNLVIPHNSEHEWWFSSIAEHCLPQLAQQLTAAKATSPRLIDA